MKFPPLTQSYVDWINAELQPNVYAVGTLKQNRIAEGSFFRSRITGTNDLYESAVRQVICRLSVEVYGKKHWRRFKSLIPNAVTLEGNGEGKALRLTLRGANPPQRAGVQSGSRLVRYHANMMFRRPDWISFDDFQQTVAALWAQNPWAMPSILIEERVGDCIAYSLKEGPETLVVNALSL